MPATVTQADLEMLLGGLTNKALGAALKVHAGVISPEDARAICLADVVRYSKAVAKLYDGTAHIDDGKFVVDDDARSLDGSSN